VTDAPLSNYGPPLRLKQTPSAPTTTAPLLVTLLRDWGKIVITAVLLAAIVGSIVLLRPREYAAVVSLTPVNSGATLSGSAALAGTLLNMQTGAGLQPTPAFVTRLARMDGVLLAVAQSPIRSGGAERVVDRLAREQAGGVLPERTLRVMRNAVSATYDLQTGIVTLRVVDRDSALARVIVNRLVERVSDTFVRASRAQATEIRRGEDARIDSAYSQLRRTEEALQEFASSNREAHVPYSQATLTQRRLERALDLAQQVYAHAVADRESAIARELEATPAVVVLDPVPAVIPPEPRGVVVKTLLAALLGALVAMLLLLIRARLRQLATEDDARGRAILDALHTAPLIGRFVPGQSGPRG
jgi:hypothetical protein